MGSLAGGQLPHLGKIFLKLQSFLASFASCLVQFQTQSNRFFGWESTAAAPLSRGGHEADLSEEAELRGLVPNLGWRMNPQCALIYPGYAESYGGVSFKTRL